MSTNLAKGHTLYIRSMGKALRVTGMFATDDEANAWMETHPDDACVAVLGHLVLTAGKYDKGINLPSDPAK